MVQLERVQSQMGDVYQPARAIALGFGRAEALEAAFELGSGTGNGAQLLDVVVLRKVVPAPRAAL